MLYLVLREEPSPTKHKVRKLRHSAATREEAERLMEEGDELWFLDGSSMQRLDETTQPITESGQLYLF